MPGPIKQPSCMSRNAAVPGRLIGLAAGFLLFSDVALSDLSHIGAKRLAALLERNHELVLVDLRREDEWRETGVIQGSSLNTFFDRQGRYNTRQWLSRLMERASSDTPLVMICQHGVRSRMVSGWLEKNDLFDEIYNLKDGIVEWRKAGLPLQAYP